MTRFPVSGNGLASETEPAKLSASELPASVETDGRAGGAIGVDSTGIAAANVLAYDPASGKRKPAPWLTEPQPTDWQILDDTFQGGLSTGAPTPRFVATDGNYRGFGGLIFQRGGTAYWIYRKISGAGQFGPGLYGQIVYVTSTDGWKTTSNETVIVTETSVDLENLSCGITPTGRIVIFYVRYNPDTDVYLSLDIVYSDDVLATFSSPYTIPVGAETIYSPGTGDMQVCADGKLLFLWYGQGHTVYAIASTDNGATWGASTTVVSDVSLVPTEASCVYCGGGVIVGLTRNNNSGEFTQFLSTNNGATWTNQGQATFDITTDATPPYLMVVRSRRRQMIACYYVQRTGTPKLRAVYATAPDLVKNGVSGWQRSHDLITGGIGYASGYITATQPFGDADPRVLGVYSRGGWPAYFIDGAPPPTPPQPERVSLISASGATQTLPDAVGTGAKKYNRIVLTANCTITLPNASSGDELTLALVQGGSGSYTVTWPGAVQWPGGAWPTLATTVGHEDIIRFLCLDGTTWLAYRIAADVSIVPLYRASVLADTPVAYWRLDEPSGTSAADATGNGHTGTYTPNGGSYTLSSPGATSDSNAAVFLTGNAWVSVPDNAAFHFSTGDYTLEAWFLAENAGAAGILIGANGASDEFYLEVNNGTGFARFTTYPVTLAGAVDLRAGLAWHHIVGTRVSGVGHLYVDGTQVATGAMAASASPAVAIGIGGVSGGLASCHGTIDEPAIYNTALSATRVLAHYNAR